MTTTLRLEPTKVRRRSTSDSPTPTRIKLQHRAPRNIRKRGLETALRVFVLVMSDLTTCWVLLIAIGAMASGQLDFWGAAGSRLVPGGLASRVPLVVAVVLSLLVVGAYGPGDKRRDTRRVASGVTLATLLSFYSLLWDALNIVLGVQLLIFVGLFSTAIILSRYVIDLLVRILRRGMGGAPVIIVARDDLDWAKLEHAVTAIPDLRVAGRVRFRSSVDGSVDRNLQSLGQLIEEARAEVVLLWGSFGDAEFTATVDLTLASGCRLISGPRTGTVVGVEPKAVWMGGRSWVELTAPSLQMCQLLLKRLVDVVASSIGLVLLAPVFVVVALAVKLESHGPVFFRQIRVGRAAKRFKIFKFRSMVVDAEQQREALLQSSLYPDERLFKVVDDPRITRVGRWLRKTSLDELPQLVNVLTGDMSLVGPRPPTPSEVALYEERHYWRFDVKPGITVPCQVSGRNKLTDCEEAVRLESEYIRDWSIRRDLWILMRTLPVVLRMSGAH